MDEQNPAEVEDLADGAGMTSGSETQGSHQASLMCRAELTLVVTHATNCSCCRDFGIEFQSFCRLCAAVKGKI